MPNSSHKGNFRNTILYIQSNRVLLLFMLVLAIVYLGVEFQKLADFRIYLDAGKLLNQKRDIYSRNELNDFKYYYSPLFACFISLFSNLNYLIPTLIWKLFNLFLLFRIWKILENHFLDLETLKPQHKDWFRIFTFLGIYLFAAESLHYAQMTIFMLYAILEGIKLVFFQKKLILGSLLIALAINIKIIPVVLLPYLIYRKEFKPAMYILAFVIVSLLLPALFVGWEYNSFLHNAWWNSINPLNSEHIVDVDERGFHSLSSLFGSLFSSELGNLHNLQIRRHILDLEPQIISMILNFSRFILIVCTIWILKLPAFTPAANRKQQLCEIGYILLITPLIFPHQQVYSYLLILPALAFIFNEVFIEFKDRKTIRFRHVLLALSLLTYNSVLILGFMRPWLEHFKILVYGMLLFLIVFLIYSSRLSRTESTDEITESTD